MGVFGKFKEKVGQFSPSNFQVVNKEEYGRVTQDYYEIHKNLNEQYLMSNSRGSLSNAYMDTPEGSKVPIWRVQPNMQYELADYVGDLRAILETIQREMFRNGLKVQSKYKYKCLACLKEFKEKPLKNYVPLEAVGRTQKKEELQCDECGNDNEKKWKKPKSKNRVILQSLLDRKVNNNNQSLKIVSRQVERDMDIIDGSYTLVSRKWKIVKLKEPDPLTGAVCEALKNANDSDIDEIIRINPTQVSIVANDNAVLGVGQDNLPRYICPDYAHRDHTLKEPVCDVCGCKAFNAFIETNAVPYGIVNSGNYTKMMYAKEEIIWIAGKYYPDLLYGNSPIQSIWKKVMSLMYQDEYIWKYFDKDRPPKSLLAIGSRNPESVQAFMERQRQGARQDPYMPRPLLLNTENAAQSIQFIDLTPNLKELELNDLRRELRQIISAVYGIQPLFFGEQAKAGLGNESLQVTITNRTIKWFQRFINENFFAPIAELFDIDDWEIVLEDSEEIDMLREEQVRGQQIDNASKMYAMAFDVETDGNGDIQISQKPNPERQQMMMGTGGGMPGQNVSGGNPQKVKSPSASKENQTKFDGEPKQAKPTDIGGNGQGSPASGSGTTLSNKSLNVKDIIRREHELLDKGIEESKVHEMLQEEFSKPKSLKKTSYKIIKNNDGTKNIEVIEK